MSKLSTFLLVVLLHSTITRAGTNDFPAEGNVRIGTSDTAYAKLDVRSFGYPSVVIWANSSNTAGAEIWQNNLTLRQLFSDSIGTGRGAGLGGEPFCGSTGGINYYGSGTIKFLKENATNLNQDTAITFLTRAGNSNSTVDTEKMRISSTGNIGIGISNPTAKLHVKGNSALNAMLKLENEAANYWALYCARDSMGAPYSGRFVLENAAGKGFYISGSTGMVIKQNTAVEGTLSAKEVKVTTTGFPDYVFAEDYKLRTLDEVEAHIKEHKHLPGIPSAAEVERDGLALSEISKKQMEKIEELTLYLIEMKKENEALKKRMEALEAARINSQQK